MKKYYITTIKAESLFNDDEITAVDFSNDFSKSNYLIEGEYQNTNALFDQINMCLDNGFNPKSGKYNTYSLNNILFKLDFGGICSKVNPSDFIRVNEALENGKQIEDKALKEAEKIWRLYHDGFEIFFGKDENGDDIRRRYRYFEHGANMVRNKTDYFIDEEIKKVIEPRIMLDMDLKNVQFNPSKYYAYRGLYLTDGVRVEGLGLNENTVIVIKDCSEKYYSKMHGVELLSGKQIDKTNRLKLISAQKEPEINLFDGQGIISPEMAGCINSALNSEIGQKKNAGSFQIRMPFGKGMLHTVDFKRFFREELNKEPAELWIEDIFGIKRNLLKAEIILTESQFKFAGAMKTWQEQDKITDPMKEYFNGFYKYNHALYIKATELKYKDSGRVEFNYQFLNALPKLDSNTFKELVNEVIDPFFKTDENGNYALDFSDKENLENTCNALVSNENSNIASAIRLNPYFIYETEVKEELRKKKQSALKKLVRGKFRIDGTSKYIVRDPLYFLIYLAGKACKTETLPKDLKEKILGLESFFVPGTDKFKNGESYAMFRNPCYSKFEPALLKFCNEEDLYKKYFAHLGGCVFISRDSIAISQLGGADQDGDRCVISLDERINSAVKEYGYNDEGKRNKSVVTIPGLGGESIHIRSEWEDRFNESLVYCLESLFNGFNSSIGRISNLGILLGKANDVEEEKFSRIKEFVKDESNSKKPEYSLYCDEYCNIKKFIKENIVPEACPDSEDEKIFDVGAYATIVGGVEIDSAKTAFTPDFSFMIPKKPTRARYIEYVGKKDGKIRGYDFGKKKEDLDKDRKKIVREIIDFDENVVNIDNLPSFFKVNFDRALNVISLPKKAKDVQLFTFETEKDWESEIVNDEKSMALLELINAYVAYCSFSKTYKEKEDTRKEIVKIISVLLMRKYDSFDSVITDDLTVIGAFEAVKDYLCGFSLPKDTIRTKIINTCWEFLGNNEERKAEILYEITGKDFYKESPKLQAAIRAILFDFRFDGYRMLPLMLIQQNIIETMGRSKTLNDDYEESENVRRNTKAYNEMKRCFFERKGIRIAEKVLEDEQAVYSDFGNDDIEDGDGIVEEKQISSEKEIVNCCRRYLREIFKKPDGSFNSAEAIKYCRALKKNRFMWRMFTSDEIAAVVNAYRSAEKQLTEQDEKEL